MSRITITLVLLLLSLAQTRQQKSLIGWTDEDEVRASSVSDQFLQFSLQVVSRHGQTVPVSEPVLVSHRKFYLNFCPLVHLFNDTIDLETDRVHDEVGLVDHYQRNLQ